MERQPAVVKRRPRSAATFADVRAFFRDSKNKAKQALHLDHHGTISCAVCYDDHPRKHLVHLGCGHAYCKPCFEQLILNACDSEADWPPRCCSASAIDHKTCLKNTRGGPLSLYKHRHAEYSVPRGQRYYCPSPDCGLFVAPNQDDTPFRRARCGRGHVTCMDCGKAGGHEDAAECPRNVAGMEEVLSLARAEGWRRCYSCLTMIEHRSMCRHIKCKCGAQFCYVCGAKWWTCGCTERQLEAIKKRARQRQREPYW